jgi:hypothetical protein
MNSCVSAPACQSMETNGTQPDAISQTVAGLAPGKSYTLSWEYGNRPGANGTEFMNVLLNTAVVATNSDDGSGNWDANSYHFVATASSYVLTFAGQPGTGNPSYGNEVTDVSLIAAVPEPSPLIILAVAAAGLIGAMWRRGAAHSPTTLPRADLSRKAREIDPWGCVSGHREFSLAFSRPISVVSQFEGIYSGDVYEPHSLATCLRLESATWESSGDPGRRSNGGLDGSISDNGLSRFVSRSNCGRRLWLAQS